MSTLVRLWEVHHAAVNASRLSASAWGDEAPSVGAVDSRRARAGHTTKSIDSRGAQAGPRQGAPSNPSTQKSRMWELANQCAPRHPPPFYIR